jgi:hypothetical protein
LTFHGMVSITGRPSCGAARRAKMDTMNANVVVPICVSFVGFFGALIQRQTGPGRERRRIKADLEILNALPEGFPGREKYERFVAISVTQMMSDRARRNWPFLLSFGFMYVGLGVFLIVIGVVNGGGWWWIAISFGILSLLSTPMAVADMASSRGRGADVVDPVSAPKVADLPDEPTADGD